MPHVNERSEDDRPPEREPRTGRGPLAEKDPSATEDAAILERQPPPNAVPDERGEGAPEG